MPTRVGVLALQGDFAEHASAFRQLGAEALEVRTAEQLAAVDRLVLPGGESTTIGKLLLSNGLLQPLRERAQAGMPLWGTCAGAILMATELQDGIPGQPTLALMDMRVRRNAFGSQLESFEASFQVQGLEGPPVTAVFIRAPVIEAVGPGVEVLSRLGDGRIVAARQGKMLATSFHPELTEDRRLQALFLSM